MKTKNVYYMLYHFPKLSETFILNELIYFKKKNKFNLRILALEKTDMDFVFEFKDELVNNAIYMIHWGRSIKYIVFILKILVYFFIRNPIRFICSFRFLPFGFRYYSLFISAIYFAYNIKDGSDIHIHSPFSSYQLIISQIIAYLLECTYSFTDQAGDYIKLNPYIYKAVYNAKFIVTSTEYNKNLLLRYSGCLNEKKIKVIYCAIDPDKFIRKTDYILFPLNLLTVARLVPEKGLEYLIKAVALLKEDIEFKLYIIGDGVEKDKLFYLVDNLKLRDYVVFCGKLSNDVVIDYYERASIFILPSVMLKSGRSDSQPVVIKEAMAMELPVISTYVAGIPEIIKNEENGFLVRPKDHKAIYKKIMDIYSLKYDVDKIRKYARETIIRRFNMRHELHKLEILFNKL